ncbi:MAG TPA: MFS transporter, partial [Roseiflexaceae bacterium]|nr:MFS transporter [Roseiflexaceae bacterium]
MVSGMGAEYLYALRRFSRDVRLYLITAALIGFTIFGGIYTVLLNLYLVRLGYGPAFVGLVNAAGPLAMALFCLPAGALGGRWGSRRAMIAGLCLSIPGFGLLPLAEFVPPSFRAGWLLATYIVGHLGFALYIVNANPFLTGITTTHGRNHVFSVQAALWPLAGFAGSLVGGMLPGLLAAPLRASLAEP